MIEALGNLLTRAFCFIFNTHAWGRWNLEYKASDNVWTQYRICCICGLHQEERCE